MSSATVAGATYAATKTWLPDPRTLQKDNNNAKIYKVKLLNIRELGPYRSEGAFTTLVLAVRRNKPGDHVGLHCKGMNGEM